MNFVANFRASRKKRNIVFRNEGGGGGSEVVWKFSENSSKMVHTVVPKLVMKRYKMEEHNFLEMVALTS